ncbi:FUSC family protein, partial [Micromonospora tulbaghiae]|uniref:FUSC family protein n=1 Tax=Micromonospora tulbaghiae TaxID=479978 RepID=UPI0034097B86
MTDRRADDTVRSPLDRAVERGGLAFSRVRDQGGAAGRNRLRQLEITVVISAQAGLAAALAALLAQMLLGSGAHVFAPAAAVGTIATAIGQRARRTFELLVGVGLGIVVGDLLRALLGSGSWQTGLVVTLAVATALLVAGRGGALVGQAGGTAVLIATLAPVQPGLELPRIFDALVGGLVGLFVVALLLPVNPIRVLDRAVEPVVTRLTEQLDAVAWALTRRDAGAAQRALDDLRGIEPDIGRLNEALSGAEEVVTIAPARWHRRARFHRYADADPAPRTAGPVRPLDRPPLRHRVAVRRAGPARAARRGGPPRRRGAGAEAGLQVRGGPGPHPGAGTAGRRAGRARVVAGCARLRRGDDQRSADRAERAAAGHRLPARGRQRHRAPGRRCGGGGGAPAGPGPDEPAGPAPAP